MPFQLFRLCILHLLRVNTKVTRNESTSTGAENDYETIESLDIEEGDYFPIEEINRALYGENAVEDEWEVVFRTASFSENESTHLLQDPEGRYVLFSSNIDNYHSIKQIGDEVEAEPVTPDGEEVHPSVTDCFRENVLGDRGNIYECEFSGSTLHITLRIKDGWEDEELEILRESSMRDVSYEVTLDHVDSEHE